MVDERRKREDVKSSEAMNVCLITPTSTIKLAIFVKDKSKQQLTSY